MKCKRFICAAAVIALCLSGCGQRNTYETEAFIDEGVTAVQPNNNAGTAIKSNEINAPVDDDIFENDFTFDDITTGAQDPGIIIKESDDQMYLPTPRAGLLTAGVWSDNENWGFFSNLIHNGTFAYPDYGLDPTKRIMVNVKTSDGKPAANIPVELLDKGGKVIWRGVSDYQGRVYLMNKTGGTNVSFREVGSDKKQDVTLPKTTNSGSEQSKAGTYTSENELVIDGASKKYDSADIMFIIDTTGSMFDEMDFLQTEFTEITNRIGSDKTRYSVNFYRDEGDEYLTKCNPFSSDVKEVQDILNKEDANGGKGNIAAVAQALDETMNATDWSEESVKLAFLIFDAPPYEEARDSLAASVETAAEKGIRLIPVIGSDSDFSVETFGRAIAIETGGTYVFLTNDSGIGGNHEEPKIGEHEVKPLVDIITDIINEYRQTGSAR